MKILTILGSPRKKGNTDKVLTMFEDNVAENHDVERINITQYKVGGCLGCYTCKEKKDEPGCVQEDDALTILDKMIQADAIVYATPLYCWSFTSQIKPLIDRHFCLVSGEGTPDYDSLIAGKPAALLVTCAGPKGPKRAKAMTDVGLIPNGAVAVSNGKIVAVGPTANLKARYTTRQNIDAQGQVVCPGFVDPHTHVVYAGDRVAEFEMRIKGASYLEIMAAGGGIVSTTNAVREASVAQLVVTTVGRREL